MDESSLVGLPAFDLPVHFHSAIPYSISPSTIPYFILASLHPPCELSYLGVVIATLTMARVDPETGNHPPDQVYPDGNRAILPPSSYSEAPPVGYCRSAHAPPPQSQGHASGSRSPSDARVCDAQCDALQHYNTQVVHPRQQQLLIPNTGSSLARGGGRGGCSGPDQVRQDSSDYF